jgi:hypothetical protein
MKYLSIKTFFTRSFLIIGIMCCCSLYARSQSTDKPAKDAKTDKPATDAKTAKVAAPGSKGTVALIDTFFKKYKDGGTSPAIDYIFGTNKLFTDTTQISVLKTKLDALRQTIGKYIGHELIVQKTASPSLVFYSYLVKHENQPIRFTFMFYKPKNDWVLYRFKFDDQMDTELEEAGKINNKHAQ